MVPVEEPWSVHMQPFHMRYQSLGNQVLQSNVMFWIREVPGQLLMLLFQGSLDERPVYHFVEVDQVTS
jgi:hypothetical protein